MLVIGSDHGGFLLKQEIKKHLEEKGVDFVDVGCYDENSVDYPDVAKAACDKITSGECDIGILICGTGIGMSLVANKVAGIRCVVCSEPYSAQLSRMHNDTNMLALGARVVGAELAKMIARIWLETAFEGGRHQNRVDMITAIEQGGTAQDA